MAETLTIIVILLVAITLFHVGLLIGWLLNHPSEKVRMAKLKTLIAVVVAFGWLSATAAGILLTGYTVSPMLHALMGAIVGYFFTDDGIEFNIGRDK